jgi:hypothetical protein
LAPQEDVDSVNDLQLRLLYVEKNLAPQEDVESVDHDETSDWIHNSECCCVEKNLAPKKM